mgnify:CR=1 FL=1
MQTALDRFALRLEPNGVYRVDGRVIPVCDNCTNNVGADDDSQSIISIHGRQDVCVGLLGAVIGMDVEKRVLELPIRA